MNYRAELPLLLAAKATQLTETEARAAVLAITQDDGRDFVDWLRAFYALPEEERSAITQRLRAVAQLQPDLRLRDVGSG